MKKNIDINTNNARLAIELIQITVYVRNAEEFTIVIQIAKEKIDLNINSSVWKILFLDLLHKKDLLMNFNI